MSHDGIRVDDDRSKARSFRHQFLPMKAGPKHVYQRTDPAHRFSKTVCSICDVSYIRAAALPHRRHRSFLLSSGERGAIRTLRQSGSRRLQLLLAYGVQAGNPILVFLPRHLLALVLQPYIEALSDHIRGVHLEFQRSGLNRLPRYVEWFWWRAAANAPESRHCTVRRRKAPCPLCSSPTARRAMRGCPFRRSRTPFGFAGLSRIAAGVRT